MNNEGGAAYFSVTMPTWSRAFLETPSLNTSILHLDQHIIRDQDTMSSENLSFIYNLNTSPPNERIPALICKY